ncbi:MAG: hypothetical protein KI790_20180 [Cyclobacteriaceae bacterium]|nr:hypothetical protein [Cyclobacteriaceae bacterium HetDA_MAG_MS6]
MKPTPWAILKPMHKRKSWRGGVSDNNTNQTPATDIGCTPHRSPYSVFYKLLAVV